jgi:hypothetical protein
MQPIPVKVNGDFLQAYEYSQPEKELENLILSTGIALSGADLTQIAQAIATYSAVGDYYADSGTVNNYLLSSIAPMKSIKNYQEGMTLRFLPINTNTGATTINVNSIGSVAVVDSNGNPLVGGEIIEDRECTIEFDGTNFSVSTGLTEFQTGDVKPTYRTSQSGWILVNTLGTIGDATSGASIRTNADCQALFLLLWNSCLDAQCPVVGGRGVDAPTDWAAHKKITIPAHGGKVIAARVAHALGLTFGEESHVLITTEMPAHSHGYTGCVTSPKTHANDSDNPVGLPSGGTTASAGSDGAHNNMQPTIYMNALMKL